MAKTDPAWLQALKFAVKPGVYIGKGRTDKTRVQFLKDGRKETIVLTLPLYAENAKAIEVEVLRLKEVFLRGEPLRLNAAHGTKSRGFTRSWRHAIEQFADDLSRTSQASESTRKDYVAMVERAFLHMDQNDTAPNGRHLVAAAATIWAKQHRKRKEALRNINNFCLFAVEELKWNPADWTLNERTLKQHRGESHQRREVATPTDLELLEVIDSIQEPEWKNAIQLMVTYGLRPIEAWHCVVRPDPETMEFRMFCDWQKSSGQHKNPKRWLYPLPLMGMDGPVDFNLVNRLADDQLPMPEYAPYDTKEHLEDSPAWNRLRKRYDRLGLWLRPYSFRNAYNRRLKDVAMHPDTKLLFMGHSAATNERYYEGKNQSDMLNALRNGL